MSSHWGGQPRLHPRGCSKVRWSSSTFFTNLDISIQKLRGTASIQYEPIEQDTPEEAYVKVLEKVGCSFSRDSYDAEIISQMKKGISVFGNKGLIDSPEQAGGWPPLRKGTPVLDTDRDGIPDFWEKEHGLNPLDASDASLYSSEDGNYTNIEMYLNSL